MTPETTDGLSDEELVERLATEVMGWEKRKSADPNGLFFGEWYWWNTAMRNGSGQGNHWNPLTRWDDCMEVVDRMKDRKLTFKLEYENGYTCFFFWEYWPERIGCYAKDADGRRAIVLAALKCVQALPERVK
jgi:hypothetical protein